MAVTYYWLRILTVLVSSNKCITSSKTTAHYACSHEQKACTRFVGAKCTVTSTDIMAVKNFAKSVGFEITELNEEAFEANLFKDNLSFKITAVHSVLEWFIEVCDDKTNLKYSNWFDYLGYESRESELLVSEMIQDLENTLQNIANHRYRVKRDNICEKMEGNKWSYFNG